MVSVGECSKELCGGTHLDYTGQIGIFRILSEGSISSGMRRMEAVTGRMAYKSVKNDEELILDASAILKTTKTGLPKAAEDMVLKLKSMEKEASRSKMKGAAVNVEIMISRAEDIDGVKLISSRVENVGIPALRDIADDIKRKAGSSIIVLGSEADGKVSLVCSVSDELAAKGANAGDIIKRIAQIVGGSGGGKATFAQAGGKDTAKLNEALAAASNIVREEIKK
ncbi:MAG: DHHA1 domain-containing protein [Candidatus Omnitrophica bacterium]|nr:DHHA1 domain-containing protein [Candidatus Omnitrophota bacterium]